jgi:hypothetical protein
MNPPFTPENNLFAFNKSALVLYVEKSYNAEINDFIKSNYKQLVDSFNAKNIDFCYLPYLLQNKDYQAVVSYNRPYLQSSVEQVEVQQIYNRLIAKQKNEVQKSGLLLYASFGFFDRLIAAPLEDEPVTLDLFNDQLIRIADYITRTRDNMPRFQMVSRRDEEDDDEQEDDGIMYSIDVHEFPTEVNEATTDYQSKPQFKRIGSVDYSFKTEAFKLADEIRERIELLKEYDSLSLIGDILEQIQNATRKLSPLFITNDYRIFLKDYGMKEVEMPPLPKSVFILFLRHPEGILFKQLADYHDELLSIYRNITLHENIDRAMDSIRAMTDPLNNSINEKCSRIRAAFLEVISDELAKNYYVTGKRGEPKMINIDRSLVEFQ